jgi:hypothetical protein
MVEVVAIGVVQHLLLPHDLAGLGIEGHDLAIQGPEVHIDLV